MTIKYALATTFCLTAGILSAEPSVQQGVSASRDAAGGLIVTANSSDVQISIDFRKGDGETPDHYELHTGLNAGTDPVSVSGNGCTLAVQPAPMAGVAWCRAQGLKTVAFVFKNGGQWVGFNSGENGKPPADGCGPAAVTIETNGGATTVGAWNGCHETVACHPTSDSVTSGDVDATDVIRGESVPACIFVKHKTDKERQSSTVRLSVCQGCSKRAPIGWLRSEAFLRSLRMISIRAHLLKIAILRDRGPDF